MSDEIKVLLSILVIGILTTLGLNYYNKTKEERYLKIERECTLQSSSTYTLIRKDNREGIVYTYKCNDNTIQKVYR